MSPYHSFAASAPPLPPSAQRRALQYSEATIAQKYAIAQRVRQKLGKEAARPEHRLRYLVCHANTLDWLIEDLLAARGEPADGIRGAPGEIPAKVDSQSSNHSLSNRHNTASQIALPAPASIDLVEETFPDGDKSPEETDSDGSSCTSDEPWSKAEAQEEEEEEEDDDEEVFFDWDTDSIERIESLSSVIATAEADEKELVAGCRSPELEKADPMLNFDKADDDGVEKNVVATVSVVAFSP